LNKKKRFKNNEGERFNYIGWMKKTIGEKKGNGSGKEMERKKNR